MTAQTEIDYFKQVRDAFIAFERDPSGKALPPAMPDNGDARKIFSRAAVAAAEHLVPNNQGNWKHYETYFGAIGEARGATYSRYDGLFVTKEPAFLSAELNGGHEIQPGDRGNYVKAIATANAVLRTYDQLMHGQRAGAANRLDLAGAEKQFRDDYKDLASDQTITYTHSLATEYKVFERLQTAKGAVRYGDKPIYQVELHELAKLPHDFVAPHPSYVTHQGDMLYTIAQSQVAASSLAQVMKLLPPQVNHEQAAHNGALALALIIARKNNIADADRPTCCDVGLEMPTAEEVRLGMASLKAGILSDGKISYSREMKHHAVGDLVSLTAPTQPNPSARGK